VNTFAAYQPATGCTKYGPAGAQAITTYTEDVFRELHRSLGICNCRSVVGGSSWSHHAECRAADSGFVITRDAWGFAFAQILAEHGARLGIDHIITNARPWESGRGGPLVYSARSPNGRTYTGSHPHKDHNHTGLTRNAGRFLTYATLVAVVGTPAEVAARLKLAATPGGEDMFVKRGDNSMAVKYWQRRLTRLGQDLTFDGGPPQGIDGIYGGKTATAVKAVVGGGTDGEQIHDLEAEAIDAKILGAAGVFATKAEFDTHRHPEGTTGRPK
jgi:hypothetical protein